MCNGIEIVGICIDNTIRDVQLNKWLVRDVKKTGCTVQQVVNKALNNEYPVRWNPFDVFIHTAPGDLHREIEWYLYQQIVLRLRNDPKFNLY